MTDEAWGALAVIALAAILVILALYDLDVARELRTADHYPPLIPFLRLVKGIVYGISVSAILAALLGIQTAVFIITGVRLLPQPIPFLALAAICIVASVMVSRLRRWIRSQ